MKYKIKTKVRIQFPIVINLQCQRSGAEFGSVKITSYLKRKSEINEHI